MYLFIVLATERDSLAGQDFLKLLLNQEDPEEFDRMLRYHQYFSRARAELLSDYRATMTEIADYAKHLWAHAAELHCPGCGQLVHRDAPTRAAQTVMGSAKLLLDTDEHPGRLKDRVTSPGGTAIAGLHTLEEGGLRTTLINAVESATMRARALGKTAGEDS